MEEEEIEQTVDKKFHEIIAEGKADQEIIKSTEIREAIKGMKNKKTGDKNNRKAEWIKGGKMVQSVATLFNRVEENKIPIQWRETKINSVCKGGNKERIHENQKEIFLMNILCKVYEKMKKLQNENKQANIISSMQTAGKKNRSTMDN